MLFLALKMFFHTLKYLQKLSLFFVLVLTNLEMFLVIVPRKSLVTLFLEKDPAVMSSIVAQTVPAANHLALWKRQLNMDFQTMNLLCGGNLQTILQNFYSAA